MYAKLQYGFLRSAPKTIVLDGKTINNPLPEELEQLGYKPVVYTDMPTEVTDGKHWESEWTEGETEITQVWKLVDDYDLEQIRTLKKSEISEACEQTIYNGIDVEMSIGTQHFSLTEKDQINIFGLQATIESGETQIEYHSDGNPCIYYSVEDIQKLIVLNSHGLFHMMQQQVRNYLLMYVLYQMVIYGKQKLLRSQLINHSMWVIQNLLRIGL